MYFAENVFWRGKLKRENRAMESPVIKFDDSWKDITTIIVYGFGRQGQGYIAELSRSFRVVMIIDNGMEDAGSYQEIPIVTLRQFLQSGLMEKIIITAAGAAHQSIKQSLIDEGKKENRDFIDADAFLVGWFWQFKKEVHLGRVSTAITEKCTLRCKNCITYMPYYNQPVNYGYEAICHNIDMLCSLADSIACLNIVGGEPFLSYDLIRYLDYIMSNHANVIGKIVIITNGTIVPDEEMFYALRKYNAEVRISDYTDTVPYQRKLKELIEKLENNGVDYQRIKFDEWLDMGTPNENICMGETPDEVREHMFRCNGRCQFLCQGKYFYCSRQWAAEGAFQYQLAQGDYLVLDELMKDAAWGKEKLLNFHVGNLEKGYCEYCRICRGFDSDSVVKAGEQIAMK